MARKSPTLDEVDIQILKAMKEIGRPAAPKEIGEHAGIDARRVAAKMRKLKRLGYVDSPEKGKYVITEEGVRALEAQPTA
jgi:predicted transcriptional regulator